MSAVAKYRRAAFHRQNGKCCYCGFPMWQDSPELFAKQRGISVKQARHFQCTAEHLLARQDGGKDSRVNIAAACIRCNQRRHKRKVAVSAEKFRCHVQKRVRKGGWHVVRPAMS